MVTSGYTAQQHTPLWPVELYTLGVPPNGAAHVLLLSQADYIDGLVGLFDPKSCWL